MENEAQFTDLSYLHEISGGDETFIKEIIDLFIAQMPEAVETMKAAYENNEPVKLGKTAHKAKPSAIYIGNKTLEDKLKTLQELKETETLSDETRTLLSEVEALSKNAVQELQKRYE